MPIRPSKEDQNLIHISESVKTLEEKFPWLADVNWNDHEDKKAREHKRKLEKEE